MSEPAPIYATAIPLAKIRVARNPRKTFDPTSLRELADSIREHGVIEPILVEQDDQGYVLVAGERRLRAAQMAGLEKINSIVRERSNHGGRERFIVSIVENDQREDMNAMDRAEAYQALQDEFGMSVRAIALKVGKADNVIRNFIMLTKLDAPIRQMIREGFWKDARLAKALLDIPDAEVRIGLAERLHKSRVSLKTCLHQCAKVTEALSVSKRKAGRPASGKPKTPALQTAVERLDADDVDETTPPARWDMLRQLGKVPAWSEVVASAASTCAECPLRGIASMATCRDCGAVVLLKKLMEGAQ